MIIFLRTFLAALLIFQASPKASEPMVSSNDISPLMQGIIKVNESLYYQDLLDQKARLIMERLEDHNIGEWKKFAKFEVDHGFGVKTFIAKEQNISLTGHPLDGANHFKEVLDKVNHYRNEIWIVYLTDNLDPPQPYENSLRRKDSILYCMTVVTSPEALITSHMGINKTIGGVKKNFRGNSLHMHKFAAKVMLSLNPQRRFMINAPAWVMESIIAEALPGGLHAGTREMYQNLNRMADLSFNAWLKTPEAIQIKERLLAKGLKEGSAEFKKDLLSQFKSNFPYVERRSGQKQSLWEFLKENPPIISLGYDGRSIRNKMVIYEAPESDKVFLEISWSNYDTYDWMFTPPFAPAGVTHYIAVDLKQLAHK